VPVFVLYFVNFFFFLETGWKIYAFGVVKCWNTISWILKVEWVLQPLMIASFVWFAISFRSPTSNHSQIVRFLGFVVLLRTLRVSMFLNELKIWQNFIRALNAMSKPFINLSITMYSLLLLYAVIGMTAFGGVINTNSIVTIVDQS
jgi:hypothetical protein